MKGGIATPKLSADQRKALADMLGAKSDARRRAHMRYNTLRAALERSVIEAKAKEAGATALVDKVADLRKRIVESERELEQLVATLREAHGRAVEDFRKAIDEGEEELRRLGLDAERDGELSIRWNADELRRAVHEQIERQIGSESAIDQRFDQAQAKVLTAETAEEAAEIVESLL